MILLFYILAFFLLASCFSVVISKNPIYSVLSLIFAFLNAAALFIMLEAELIAMSLIIVYVGAVAVLFLFTVMMLDIDLEAHKRNLWQNLPVGITIVASILVDLILIIYTSVSAKSITQIFYPIKKNLSNVKAIGNVLYTDFMLPFQLAGLILFVAMIGCIILTLPKITSNMKRQNKLSQLARTKESTLNIVKVVSKKGISID